MHVRRHDHAKPRACVDVDVRVHAALADQPELGQSLEEWRRDFCPLSNKHQGFGVAKPFGQRVDVVHMVVPDPDLVTGELPEARKCSQRVVVIVEDGNFHGPRPGLTFMRSLTASARSSSTCVVVSQPMQASVTLWP